MIRRPCKLLALAVIASLAISVPTAASASPGNWLTKSMSAQEYKSRTCRILRADEPFQRAVYAGGGASVSRAQFTRRLGKIRRAAGKAEAAYNRVLEDTGRYYPWHPSVRRPINRLMAVTDQQRWDLFELAWVTRTPRGAWREFNQWRDRNPTWVARANRVDRILGVDFSRC